MLEIANIPECFWNKSKIPKVQRERKWIFLNKIFRKKWNVLKSHNVLTSMCLKKKHSK